MRILRLLTLLIGVAFFLPACGFSSPTDLAQDVPVEAVYSGEEGECDPEEPGEPTCRGGFLGSGS